MKSSTNGNRPAARAALTFGVAALAAGWALIGPRAQAAAATKAAASSPAAPSQKSVDTSNPYRLIQSAASAMLRQLDAHRAEYQHDPKKVDALVDRILLPHFDVQYAARLVLGRHWNTATPQQRSQFTTAFYHSLLSTYGSELVNFRGNQMKVLPWRGDADARYATVRTRVRSSSGSLISVDYRLRRTDHQWKAWDVVIEGISYVASFRNDFNEQIEQQGIGAVIQRLEHGKVPASIRATHGG